MRGRTGAYEHPSAPRRQLALPFEPVNLAHYADLRHGQFVTGLAGPAANLALAVLGGCLAWTA
jgi:Zn-dependent protease